MYLSLLEITNFRNYISQKVKLKNGINIFIGNNAQGKTNLLETIYFLSMAKSHRGVIDKNLINSCSEYTRIKAEKISNEEKTILEIALNCEEKILKINNNQIKLPSDYVKELKTIIFFPEDLDLLKGSPDERRKYLNNELIQIYDSYGKILNDYNKLLKNRNEYIKYMRYKEPYNENYFEILNDYYIKKSILIYKLRKKYIDKINEKIDEIFKDITGDSNIRLKYIPIIDFDNFNEDEMYIKIKDILNKKLKDEIDYGKSIYGPHRDDFLFLLDNNDLKCFGSQGQQRAAVISLKLSEIEIFRKSTGSSPILLLDDVFSELDEFKKNNLLKYIDNKIQTIITSTDLNSISTKLIKKAKIFEVKEGKIKLWKGEKNGKEQSTL